MSWSVFKLAWAKNGTPDTLTSSGDTLSVSDLIANQFLHFLSHKLTVGGAINAQMEFDSDTSTNYARRFSTNGGSDSTGTSESNALTGTASAAEDMFSVGYIINISGEEKLQICFAVSNNGSGAGSAPDRREIVNKWDTTAGQIDSSIEEKNGSAGSYDTDSNLSILGTD